MHIAGHSTWSSVMTKEHNAFVNMTSNECVDSNSHGFNMPHGLLQFPGEHGLNHSIQESHVCAVFNVPLAQTMSEASEMLGFKSWTGIPVGQVPGSLQDQSGTLESSGRHEVEVGTRVMDKKAPVTSPGKGENTVESQGSRVNQSK